MHTNASLSFDKTEDVARTPRPTLSVIETSDSDMDQPASVLPALSAEMIGENDTSQDLFEPAAASDLAQIAPDICDDNLVPFMERLNSEGKTAFAIWNKAAGFHLFSDNFEPITGMPNLLFSGDQWIGLVDNESQYQLHRMLEIGAEEMLPSQILVETVAINGCSKRHLILDITPVTEQPGRVMVLFYDVTVQKQLEEALTKTEVSLKKANRSRSAFLSCLSHELRTPLNAIMGFSEMMRNGVLGDIDNEKYTEYAAHIHHSGAELLDKISNLLEIAALDTGGLVPNHAHHQLSDLLNELREMYTHSAFEKQITIAVEVADDVTLHIDKRMFLSALSHIVTNALNYGRKSSTLHIAARYQAAQGLMITIRDKGAGIAPSRLSSIREALKVEATYFQIDNEGIGLGLSMAKELMARHGGHITIDSMPKHGTIVCCNLPEECIRNTAETASISAV